MDNGEPDRSGRHRVADGAALWLPFGGELHRAPAPPPQRTRDPLVDTDAMGLRKFNIGLVPASVTPPRTWKRAAWFAVLSSAGVLVGLAVAAAKLVGSSGPVERIGMPGYPTDVPLLTGFATASPTAPPPGPAVRRPVDQVRPDGVEPGMTAAPARDPSHPRGVGPGRPGTTAAPSVTTVPNSEKPLVNAEAIAVRTEKFYEEVAANADTAMAMATDTFRANTEAQLEQRFADVSLIEVTQISVDPAKGRTISTLQLTKKDGTTTTERRELVFTTGGEPLINAERLWRSA